VGNANVKVIATAWAIIGLLLMIAGLGINTLEETDGTWYEDSAGKMYSIGLALLVLAIIVYLVGVLIKPSIGEILRADRLVWENQSRLRAYREDPDSENDCSPWQD